MNSNLLANLLLDVWEDVRAPAMLWQLAALALSVALGWAAARLIGRAVEGRESAASGAVQLGLGSFSRVLTPLMVFICVVIARYGLGHFQKVHLLRVAIPVVGSLALIRFAFYLLHRIFARNGQVGGTLLLVEKVFALLVWLGVALYITGLWPDLHAFLDDIVIPMGKHKISVATILQALASVFVTLLAALWAGAALESRLMAMDGLHTSLRVVTARFGRAVLILVAVLLSLSLVGIDLTVLSVFGGALGVGLGLGLQKIASNYVSGFVILLDRSLKIGDMIAVDKYSGKVTQINTRYTVINGLDGTETVVPNEMLVSGVVQNFSLTDTALRLATQVTVAYGSDVERTLHLLEEAAAGAPRVVADPAPHAVLQKFGADGFQMEVGFWIVDPINGRGSVISDVNRAIWRRLQEENIALPFPQREIRIVSDSGPVDALVKEK